MYMWKGKPALQLRLVFVSGYVWKDKSEDGVRRMLEDQTIPLDRLLLETDSPFMFPNVRAAKVAQHVKDRLSER